MGYYATINIDFKMNLIKTKEDLFKLLGDDERNFLNEQYPDLEVDDGYIMLDEYYRKNYEDEYWMSILSKIAKVENMVVEITFVGEDGYSWGYRAYPDGEVVSLIRVFVEEDIYRNGNVIEEINESVKQSINILKNIDDENVKKVLAFLERIQKNLVLLKIERNTYW